MAEMDIRPTCLVIADISGYTKFIRDKQLSLLHAEQIITDLLDAVIDGAQHPLTLNKLEGDAALMYATCGDDVAATVVDVATQIQKFFALFRERQNQLIITGDGGCGCDACTGTGTLQLKVIAHLGDVLIKRVRQFEELAGEPVIVVHRLLKNSVDSHEYLMMTEAFHAFTNQETGDARKEDCDGFEPQTVHVFYPETEPIVQACNLPGTKLGPHVHAYVLSARGHLSRLTKPKRTFSHLPSA